MIEILKKVLSAVSTKDIVPVLTNFCLYRSLFDKKGRVQGYNGVVCIDAPFDHDIQECTVKADKFIKAVEACEGAPVFGITDTGRLSIKQGRFRAYMATLPALDYPRISQEGTIVKVPADFYECIRRMKPFISEDASRVWSTSLYLYDGFMYATNNIIVARTPCEFFSEEHVFGLVLPSSTIDRMMDMGANPTGCYVAENSITFEYGDIWLRSQLLAERWPIIAPLFIDHKAVNVVSPDFKSAVEKVRHFCSNEKFPVIKLGESVATDSGEEGASVDGFNLPVCSFHADQLLKVLAIATHLDLVFYPRPCPWKGVNIEGIVVGIKI